MKVLVCGGRDYANRDFLFQFLDSLDDVSLVIQGGARGADSLAKDWAKFRGVHCAQVDALWEIGRGAGPARNRAMLLLEPDYVVGFAGGTGTQHMISVARKAGIPTDHIT